MTFGRTSEMLKSGIIRLWVCLSPHAKTSNVE